MFAIYIEECGYYEGKIYQNDNEFYPEAEIHSISEFTKIYKTQYLAEKAAKAIYLHKTSDVFFRLIPDIEDMITIIEQEYSELSKAYQEKEKIYSSNPSIENKFEVEKAESAYITIAYLKDKLMF